MGLGARNGAWAKSGAPLPYDAEVEFLRADGSAFIDTGLLIDNTITGSVAFEIPYGKNGQPIVGSADVSRFIIRQGPYDESSSYWGKVQLYTGGGYYVGTDSVIGSHEIAVTSFAVGSRLQYTYDGVARQSSANVGSVTSDRTLLLFRALSSSAYDLAISHASFATSTQSFDMIPVRFTNENGVSEGAMYDRVSGQLFRNQGTGAFIIGPDK